MTEQWPSISGDPVRLGLLPPDHAFDAALAPAQHFGARLHLLHVVHHPQEQEAARATSRPSRGSGGGVSGAWRSTAMPPRRS
jgi:hypothetical protein